MGPFSTGPSYPPYGGKKVKVVPLLPGGRRGVTGFAPALFSKHLLVSKCDGVAYLISVAAFTSPPPKEGGYSFTTPMLVQLAESARVSVRHS